MIINSAKTKKTAWDLVVSHLIGLFVRLTQWNSKNISGDHGSKVISSLVNSWVQQLKDTNNVICTWQCLTTVLLIMRCFHPSRYGPSAKY